MTTLFACGEDVGFAVVGAGTAVDTATTAARRTSFSRCALACGSGGTPSNGDGWLGAFSSTSNSFWFTARFYTNNNVNLVAGFRLMNFRDGTTSRIELRNKTTGTGDIGIYKVTAAGVATLLATASTNITSTTLFRIDIQINYSASGFVRLYYNGGLVADTGVVDVTTDSATNLSSFVLSVPHNISGRIGYWSEIIVTDVDTRSLSLITVAPLAAGAANTFSTPGAVGNINEVTINDTTLISSATANQIAEYTADTSLITSAGGNPAVRAVSTYSRSQRGATGPQNMQHVVRVGGTDFTSATKSLITSFGQVSHVFELNPATSAAWAMSDITTAGFNIGVKSIA